MGPAAPNYWRTVARNLAEAMRGPLDPFARAALDAYKALERLDEKTTSQTVCWHRIPKSGHIAARPFPCHAGCVLLALPDPPRGTQP